MNSEDIEVLVKGVTHLEKYIQDREGFVLALNPLGLIDVIACLDRPSALDEELFLTNKGMELFFTEISNIGFIVANFDGYAMTELPLDIRIYPKEYFEEFPKEIEEGKGLPMRFILIDRKKNGLFLGARLVGLDHKFSQKLCDYIHYANENYEKIPQKESWSQVDKVYERFGTKEIARMNLFKFKFREEDLHGVNTENGSVFIDLTQK